VTDLLVVGEGLCGLFAAILSAEQGARTTLVAQGRGGLSSSHGCMDVWKQVPSADQIRRFPMNHPYRLGGWSNLDRVLRRFLVTTSRAGLAYRGSLDVNLRLPTAIGGQHSTAFAPESVARGDLSDVGSFSLGAIEGFRDFSGTLVKNNLARAMRTELEIIPLPIIGDIPRRDLYAHDLARRFDQPEWRIELARAWKPLLGGVRTLGVPAVLGLRNPAEVISSLEDKLGVRLFEIPTLPPTVPGLRLERVLRNVALEEGVQLIEGSRSIGLVDGRSGGKRVAGVVIQSAGGPRTHSAEAVLLATGGVLHGGLVARPNGRIVESVFDLPVQHRGSRATWTSDEPLGAQPFATFGLCVDSTMRPVSEEGNPYYGNLFAAGGVLGGSDRAIEGSRQGIDLLTAYRAVESALGVTLP
jgi:glycerol-3-phosphate dehydrogenase subunit B